MALIVQKFGGTSVGSPKKIRAVANKIAECHQEGHQLVIVVSAMGHTTDELIELAHQVSQDPPVREMDMLLTVGERISMALLSMALSDFKVPAISLTGSQTGILTTSSHRRARIQRILGDRVRQGLAQRKVVIVAGFQGVSESKEITTLGRGGSDTTAVALAATLGAESCEIYTDVPGIFSADPRVVPEARLWSKIPHSLMVEMAVLGAGVLHPRSVELAKKFKVPLKVEGTQVVDLSSTQDLEQFDVTGVTADKNKSLMVVELMRPTVLGAVWSKAAEYHLMVVAPVFNHGTVTFFTESDSKSEWQKALQDLIANGFVKKYQFDEGFVPLSVIGNRFSQDGGALSEVIDTLAESGISVTIGAASALSITVAAPLNKVDDGVRALHAKFLGTRNHA